MIKKVTIGLPVSPSKSLKQKKFSAKKIIISFGGGMGGSRIEDYTVKIKNLSDRIKYTTLQGESKEVFKNFIAQISDVLIVETVTDITAHSNYHKTTVKKNILTQVFCFPTNTEVSFESQFNNEADKNLIYSFGDKTPL